MICRRRLFPLLLTLVASAMAQGASTGVTESTDPARAAAVERAARDLQRRLNQDAGSGRTAPAVSVLRGRLAGGIPYMSGGITVEDRTAMHADRKHYSLWVATVARPSGAYLVDARLRIVDVASGRSMLERTMEGPWFFADLPAGRYLVSATMMADGEGRSQTLSARVMVPREGQRQAIFRFDSTAVVSPDMVSPFNGNPFRDAPVAH